MVTNKFVSYIRVSTAKQGTSGLGLEAQREAIGRFLYEGQCELLQEYREVESGKKADRPELAKALRHCQVTGATLVIAKLDRLSRDPDFLGVLMKAGTDFVACDMPDANKLTIRIMAAFAEHEREAISQRTKLALQAAKARGIVLGRPGNLSKQAADKGRKMGRAAKLAKSAEFVAHVRPLIEAMRPDTSLRQIAVRLNQDHVKTATGKGKWTATAVMKILK
ncbi:resolvase-like serine recombinase [Citrifermentans bemidjiense Bem]|uniref:Resolvase-like serine recombinase n=1 Tax=Citrifermentans bemidjiense (strain ATCC BAA-1014 / DSM 16622 / JCM 12645 / Bem) TaxID=404380 RepID=B5E830_CITBB|nr:recombinase family protein [Citrifermentans bemidjiense]ACH39999.1 resolvase-like serine recombinase [Citrifermentans bemidjiense Bem]